MESRGELVRTTEIEWARFCDVCSDRAMRERAVGSAIVWRQWAQQARRRACQPDLFDREDESA